MEFEHSKPSPIRTEIWKACSSWVHGKTSDIWESRRVTCQFRRNFWQCLQTLRNKYKSESSVDHCIPYLVL
jgi:hypothetical protein